MPETDIRMHWDEWKSCTWAVDLDHKSQVRVNEGFRSREVKSRNIYIKGQLTQGALRSGKNSLDMRKEHAD